MAIPRMLKKIDTERAHALIDKHMKAGTGHWEGQTNISDFVYGTGMNLTLLRPPSWSFGDWETGRVSM